jgi:RNA polymerase sigma factor (TIGR02999 family)
MPAHFFWAPIMAEPPDDPTPDQLIGAVRAGDTAARDRLFVLLYDDLRRTAGVLMHRERPDHTLQPSALVNEAVLKLLRSRALQTADDRDHAYRMIVLAMRQILIDHARRRRTKQGKLGNRHPLDGVIDHIEQVHRVPSVNLDAALDRLAVVNARACIVTTFHSLLGMSHREVAEALEVAESTVMRDWAFARAWLLDQLDPDEVP